MLFAPNSNNSKSAQKELYSSFMAVNLNNAIIAFNSDKTAIENYLNSKNIKFEDINLKEFISKNNLNEAEFIKILIKR